MISVEWALGILFALICGAYGFGVMIYVQSSRARNDLRNDLWQAINTLKSNDLKHLEDRVSMLEGRDWPKH